MAEYLALSANTGHSSKGIDKLRSTISVRTTLKLQSQQSVQPQQSRKKGHSVNQWKASAPAPRNATVGVPYRAVGPWCASDGWTVTKISFSRLEFGCWFFAP